MTLVAEFRRRNVFRVAAAYLVVGWLLTEVLTTILPTLGAPAWMPRAVILIFAFGFFPAVVFSWFFELTPEGIKREADILGEEKVKTRASRMLDYITVTGVVVLVVFIGLFSAQQSGDDTLSRDFEVNAASVAVLPFVNMSNDDDNEYFSDGLTETLLHMLSQIPGLKVAARTSSFAFKNQNKSIQEIAAALGVAHVLEGSVQRAGDNVRITAQLIRASDGFHVWSSNYDRTLENIFDIQDEIAQKVGFALSESLLGTGSKQLAGVQTSNPDAYDIYLQARRAKVTGSFGGLKAAEDLLKGALLIDPNFIDAKTELATCYLHQVQTGLIGQEDGYSQVLAITNQVLEAKPDNVLARAARVFVQAMSSALDGDAASIPNAAHVLEALVAEAPDELQIRILLVGTYEEMQQPEKSLPVLQDALNRDPFNPQIHFELGSLYLELERYEDARASLEQSLDIEPAQPNAYTRLASISLHSGDGVGFVQNFLKALEVDPRDHELPGMLAEFLYKLGLFDEGDDFRNRVMTMAPASTMAYDIALLRAVSSGDESAADSSARQVIQDNLEDRQSVYTHAVQYLLRSAAKSGTVDDEIAWIEERAPGIFDIDADNVPQKYRLAQGAAVAAWYTTLPREELLRRMDVLLDFWRSTGFDPTDDPFLQMNILALRGEIQETIDVALSGVFSRPVAMNLGWKQAFAQPQFAELVADPRIQAAMQRWEDDEEELRGQVRTYLADIQAAS